MNKSLMILTCLSMLAALTACEKKVDKATTDSGQTTASQVVAPAEPPKDNAVIYNTKSGKSFEVLETHPTGASLSNITVTPRGFADPTPKTFVDKDPMSSVFVADLNKDGFDEIYIVGTSAGSGSYAQLTALASIKDQKIVDIQFPNEVSAQEQAEGQPYFGYSGHDTFRVEGDYLLRSFPIPAHAGTSEKTLKYALKGKGDQLKLELVK